MLEAHYNNEELYMRTYTATRDDRPPRKPPYMVHCCDFNVHVSGKSRRRRKPPYMDNSNIMALPRIRPPRKPPYLSQWILQTSTKFYYVGNQHENETFYPSGVRHVLPPPGQTYI